MTKKKFKRNWPYWGSKIYPQKKIIKPNLDNFGTKPISEKKIIHGLIYRVTCMKHRRYWIKIWKK